MNQLVSAFGANLRRLRIERNMSQKDIADAAGVQQAMISNIETGDRLPSLPLALAIAAHLGVTLDELSKNHDESVTETAAAA